MKKNIVIYMAIFGNYDYLYEPEYISPYCDYVVFTDSINWESNIWDIRYIKCLYEQPVRMSRRNKILPHRFLQEYEYSIWVDGNYKISGEPKIFIDKYLDNCNMACWDHRQCKLDPRGCIYEEANAIFEFGRINYKKSPEKGILGTYKDNPLIIKSQIDKYKKDGYPMNMGLIAAGKLYRRHNASDVIEMSEKWWNEVKYYSHLDQLSFNYVAYKNSFKFNLVNGDPRDDQIIKLMGKHKKKTKKSEIEYVPIPFQYFKKMHLTHGTGGKEIIHNYKQLYTVEEVINYWQDKDLNKEHEKLNKSNWQYFNTMIAEFKKNVEDHHKIGWHNLTKEYFSNKEEMTDAEIKQFLKENPVNFEKNNIKHSYHRAVAMVGRLVKNKSYIPFYIDKEQIDERLLFLNTVKYLNEIDNIPSGDFTICQSGILALMGIRENNDLDVIISYEARNQLFNGNIKFIKMNEHVEIFDKDYKKFQLFDCQGDDDAIQNYSKNIGGYNFLEPRFYFSKKIFDTELLYEVSSFFEMEQHLCYPYNVFTEKEWGFDILMEKIRIISDKKK